MLKACTLFNGIAPKMLLEVAAGDAVSVGARVKVGSGSEVFVGRGAAVAVGATAWDVQDAVTNRSAAVTSILIFIVDFYIRNTPKLFSSTGEFSTTDSANPST